MKTMKTVKVYEWLVNQGLAASATNFWNTFGELEFVETDGIQAFLHLVYGIGDDKYLFRKMECDVSTQMTPGWI